MFHLSQSYRGYRVSEGVVRASRRFLNRVLFQENEVEQTSDGLLVVNLNETDARYQHMRKVLKLQNDDEIKCGILNRGMTNTAKYRVNDRTETIYPASIYLGSSSSLSLCDRSSVDIVLALPRPQRFEKLLPVIGSMGIDRLILLEAERVEKDYFGTHLFRQPEHLRALLIEGLMQAACDYHLPELLIKRNLAQFIKHDSVYLFDGIEPRKKVLKLLAHPPDPLLANDDTFQSLQLHQLLNDPLCHDIDRVVIAIGPEGGWIDSEIALFRRCDWKPMHFGDRVLRTDVAVPVALQAAHELLSASRLKRKQ